MAPPATAVADSLASPERPRDSRANIDIMAPTKGVQWPYFLALGAAVLGVIPVSYTHLTLPTKRIV